MEKKEFTVRDLTSRGWERREDLDFRDDGTKFKAFEYYNGLVATYTKADGEYYLSLRVDYLGDLVYEEYSKMESYKLADEFNGVKEIDAEKVCKNAEVIMKEYLAVKEEVESRTIDMATIMDQAKKEKSMVERVLEDSNLTLEDLESFDYNELRRLKDYRNHIKKDIDIRIENLLDQKYTHKQLRQIEYKIKNCGYLAVDANGYYVNNIRQLVGKARGQL